MTLMFEKSRRKCLDIRNRLYPVAEWPGVIFQSAIRAEGGSDRTFLEIGCGLDAAVVQRLAPDFRSAVGIDLEIAQQPSPGSKWTLVRGDAHHLPFGDGTMDVIAMGDVVEHLADPVVVFRECARVLRPTTGRLILTTVNLRFPPIALGCLLPHRVRRFVNQLATGTEPENTFPVYYRANTERSLIESAFAAGLKPLSIRFLSKHPEYFMFSVSVYRLAVVLERAIRRSETLRGLRHFIHGVFEPCEDVARSRSQPNEKGA